MGQLDHGDPLWCAFHHRNDFHFLNREIPQGTSADIQLQARQTWRCGVHPPWPLPLVVLRRLSIGISSTGHRRSHHLRTLGCRAHYFWSTPAAWLPLYKQRQGNWGCPELIAQYDSVRSVSSVSTIFLIVPGSWSLEPSSRLNSQRNKGQH